MESRHHMSTCKRAELSSHTFHIEEQPLVEVTKAPPDQNTMLFHTTHLIRKEQCMDYILTCEGQRQTLGKRAAMCGVLWMVCDAECTHPTCMHPAQLAL